MYNECPSASGLIENFANETQSLRVKILPDHWYTFPYIKGFLKKTVHLRDYPQKPPDYKSRDEYL